MSASNLNPNQTPSNFGHPQSSSYAQTTVPSASYPPPPPPPPHHHHHHHHHHHAQPTGGPYPFPPPFYHLPFSQDQLMHHHRSVSFPIPPVQPAVFPGSPTPGGRLMAMLGNNPGAGFEYTHQPVMVSGPLNSSGGSDCSVNVKVPELPSAQVISAAVAQPAPMRIPSSKLPKGRHLVGDHVVYDVDVRLQGEMQPQLEVTPITKYTSDPELILGRQIAVNKMYICYGLRLGSIRVLNINTALRSLLLGHTQRVTDMAFFAEDVNLLASASIDGRVYVRRISESSDEENKPQILSNTVLAIHISGVEGPAHPRVCWHCQKQEIVVVAIGGNIFRIDTIKVGKGELRAAEEPLSCPLDKLIDGVHLVGRHDGEVTDLSMCQWMMTRLVSASKDGTIKIWEDRKVQPLLVLRPHNGYPVDAAVFLHAPHRPDHIILITAGPQNREVKLWASASKEGWLLPSNTESWWCIQTLELKSSEEPQLENAFFNQVVGLSQVGLLLFANAKKNAIYAVHLEYGANPLATSMDYLAEFAVTMPILSCTGTSEVLPYGEHIVQVYCVQTQAIQQYALDLTQCLPPPTEHLGLEKSDSTASGYTSEGFLIVEPPANKEIYTVNSAPLPSYQTSPAESTLVIKGVVSSASHSPILNEISSSGGESVPASVQVLNPTDIFSVTSSSIPLSPRFAVKLNDLQSDQAASHYACDRPICSVQSRLSSIPSDDLDRTQLDNFSDNLNPSILFKHPTHLVTPSEIMATSSSDITHVAEEKGKGEAKIQDVHANNAVGNVELEIKAVDAAGLSQNDISSFLGEQQAQIKSKEKSVSSRASDTDADLSSELCALPAETSFLEKPQSIILEVQAHSSNSGDEVDEITTNDNLGKSTDFPTREATPQSPVPSSRERITKGENSQETVPSSTSQRFTRFSESSDEVGVFTTLPSVDDIVPKVVATHDMVNQLVTAQKEMQKRASLLVNETITKEGRRLEAALGRSIERAAKANYDDLWARFQEENARNEKLIRDRMHQVSHVVNSFANKDVIAILERTIRKEMAAVSASVSRTLTPVVEKAITSSVTESFQRGVCDKAVNQVDKSISSKIDAFIARQIQAQFQTSGRQALQEGLKSTLEASLIPAFELSCKAMFEQIDSAFQKGMAEHTSSVHRQLESAHSPLALALKEAINSASSVTQTLNGELAEGQRKLIALAVAEASSKAANPFVAQLSNDPLAGLHEKVEQPFDLTKELSRLLSEHKYEDAFTAALQKSDVSVVSWLCSQVDLRGMLAMVPLPLSQGVLLSLLQQLSCDITVVTSRKLAWMTDVAVAINPSDPMVAMHVRPIFEQVNQILNHIRSLPTTTAADMSSVRILMHVINSMLMTNK